MDSLLACVAAGHCTLHDVQLALSLARGQTLTYHWFRVLKTCSKMCILRRASPLSYLDWYRAAYPMRTSEKRRGLVILCFAKCEKVVKYDDCLRYADSSSNATRKLLFVWSMPRVFVGSKTKTTDSLVDLSRGPEARRLNYSRRRLLWNCMSCRQQWVVLVL